MSFLSHSRSRLFCRFLFVFLGESEPLRLFATSSALLNIISTVIVPHSPQYSTACRVLATKLRDHFIRCIELSSRPHALAAPHRGFDVSLIPSVPFFDF